MTRNRSVKVAMIGLGWWGKKMTAVLHKARSDIEIVCAAAVRRQGTVVQTGLHMKPAAIDAMQWALKDITLEATWCYPVQCWPRIIRMVEAGLFPIDKIVTAEIRADDVVSKGFDALLDKSVNHMKILVTV